MAITWPSELKARKSNANLRNAMLSGPRTLTGRQPRVAYDAGFWELSLVDIKLSTRAQVAAYRAMLARLRSGEELYAPLFDCRTPAGARSFGVTASMTDGVVARQTQFRVTVGGIGIAAGHHFRVGDRLHLITAIVNSTSPPEIGNPISTDRPWDDAIPWSDIVGASSIHTVKVMPPLRTNYAPGTDISFSDLFVRSTLKEPDDGEIDLDLGRRGFASISFLESI